MPQSVFLVASGDSRLSANQKCWPAQEAVEKSVTEALAREGFEARRAHPYNPDEKHGFINSQKYGMQVFRDIPKDAPLIVVEAVWQYTHHILAGLYAHTGPILTLANFSGQWPGLVGMLNLNGSLTKAGIRFSTLWSVEFTDDLFKKGLRQWLKQGRVDHDLSHVRKPDGLDAAARAIGREVAAQMKRDRAILGVFDEGCMGMFNAIIPDELLHPTGVFKERLSQSALFAAMQRVPDSEAKAVRAWLDKKGVQFRTGPTHETDLTDEQVHLQCKMYIAAVRLADDFGCAAIGIQYQQGLKDLAPASDLVEGILNNVDRPPVRAEGNGRVLFEGEAIPHFNEVDECAGLDGLVTYRVWRKLGYDPENTLHDVRWGEDYNGEFVWVFEISGAAPPKHFIGEYSGTVSERQPPMYFPAGGGTVKGISKPGKIVWSRIYVEDGRLKADVGRGKVIELPLEETERRWQATTPQWPIMHAVLDGVSRDQMMAKHKANHVQVAYADDPDKAIAAKVGAFEELGIEVLLCGKW